MSELVFKSIKNNPAFEGLASLVPNIVYSTARGLEIKMHILTPQSVRKPDADDRHPCIVFVQGSAWTFPDVTYEIPQMSEFARNGYVVAMVTHRSALDGHKAPAFLEDVKTAIRFLRANADTYKIDPERIGIWGTSSGGNTALLVGLTADDPVYKTDEYADFVTDYLKNIKSDFYYVNMAAAWALSFVFIKYPNKVMPLLEKSVLSDEINNMTVSKIRDSLRVDKATKEYIKQFKRVQ